MSDGMADLLKAVLVLITGGGGLKILQMIRDAIRERKSPAERIRLSAEKEDRAAIDITEQLQALASEAVAGVRAEIATVREDLKAEREKSAEQGGEIRRLTTRVAQLERVIREAGAEVPAEA
jgi:hypothetical protein